MAGRSRASIPRVTGRSDSSGWRKSPRPKSMWPFGKSEKKELLEKEFEAYARKMFKPEVIQETAELFLIKKVFEVCHNKNGRMGCILARNWRADWKAVQELNNDLSFSKKAVGWTTRDWKPFNPRKYALGLILQTKRPNSMKPLSQQVNAIGHQILEMDTDYLPAMDFSEWKMIFKDWPFQ
jgi:hypothetical protein